VLFLLRVLGGALICQRRYISLLVEKGPINHPSVYSWKNEVSSRKTVNLLDYSARSGCTSSGKFRVFYLFNNEVHWEESLKLGYIGLIYQNICNRTSDCLSICSFRTLENQKLIRSDFSNQWYFCVKNEIRTFGIFLWEDLINFTLLIDIRNSHIVFFIF